MSIDELRKAIKNIEVELSEPEPWPEMGTKAWFQRYVQSIIDHDNRRERMTEEKLSQTYQSLAKFDPKFADLAKKANDTAVELMNYAQTKMENK